MVAGGKPGAGLGSKVVAGGSTTAHEAAASAVPAAYTSDLQDGNKACSTNRH